MPTFPYNGVNGLASKVFIDHVNYLKSRFTLIGIKELDDLDINKENYCLITFDDGLLCHYEFVFKKMKKHNFPAAFFINTLPISDGVATITHKMHIVRAKIAPKIILDELNTFCKGKNLTLPHLSQKFLSSVYAYDNVEDSRLKYIINYHLDESNRSTFINRLFKSLYSKEDSFIKEWYMSKTQVKEMNDHIICIGSHGHSHLPLARLNNNEIINELKLSKNIIEKVIGMKINCFSYPSGGAHAVTIENSKLVKKMGFNYAFSMEREQNLTMNYPHMFARIDCNDLPVIGKSPRFQLNDNKLLRLDNSLSKRVRYFNE